MTPRPTLKNVAQEAGVSIGTVSRVINRHQNVAADIRMRVDAAIAKLGYQPNVVAQSMRGGASRMVGVIVRDISMPMFAAFVDAAQETLMAADYTLLLACSKDQKEREADLLGLFARRGVDGVIMTTCDEGDAELNAARRDVSAPVLMLDRKIAASDEDAIQLSHREGMRNAVKYLTELGHKRIGLITGGSSVYPARERIAGYKDALKKARITFDKRLVRARDFNSEYAFIETSSLLGEKNPPSAIIAGGVDALAGVLRATQSRGLRIPNDLSVIVAGDSELAQLMTPPATTIRWSYHDLGRVGAQLLLDRMGAPDGAVKLESRQIILPTEFVIRASCAAPKSP